MLLIFIFGLLLFFAVLITASCLSDELGILALIVVIACSVFIGILLFERNAVSKKDLVEHGLGYYETNPTNGITVFVLKTIDIQAKKCDTVPQQ